MWRRRPAATFMVVWAEKGRTGGTNGWDIWGRTFSSAGVGGTVRCINTTRFGDQYLPRISWDGTDYLVVWTSLGQDGSREGVFGQFLHDDGSPDQGEFQVNTTWINQQMQPAVASDGQGRFLAAWTSFVGGAYGFDLYAQRYVNVSQPLPAMSAPFVYVPFVVSNGVYQPQIQVSWPLQAGLSIDHYDVYVNGDPRGDVNHQHLADDRGERISGQQHAFLPGGLCDDQRPAVTVVARGQRDDLEQAI